MQDAIKIGIGPDFGLGGVSQYIENVANHLSPKFSSIVFLHWSQSLQRMGLPAIKELSPLPLAIDLKKMSQVDIIHANGYGYFAKMGLLCKDFFGKRLVVTNHGLYAEEAFKRHKCEDFGWMKKTNELLVKTMLDSDAVISVSSYAKKMADEFGISSRVIHNGIDSKEFEIIKKPDNNAIRILHIGAMEASRNPRVLIDALSRADNSFELVFVGNGYWKNEIQKMAVDKGVVARFVGSVSRKSLLKLLNESNVVVGCNPCETFGIALLEGMASQNLVIAPSSGAPKEFIKNGKTGYLYDYDDPEELRKRIFCKPSQRFSIAKRARKYALKNHSWAQLVPKIEKIYTECLN